MYDITNRSSLDELHIYEEIIKTNCPSAKLIVVGNKTDLEDERQITQEDGMTYAKSINAQFFEICCKNSKCVNEIFTAITKDMNNHNNEWNNHSLLDNDDETIIDFDGDKRLIVTEMKY